MTIHRGSLPNMAIDATNPYDALRSGLIWGRWKSGERLIPQHLKDEFGCTSSVLREATLRLAGEGFVISEKNQGFRTVVHRSATFREADGFRGGTTHIDFTAHHAHRASPAIEGRSRAATSSRSDAASWWKAVGRCDRGAGRPRRTLGT